MSLLNAGAADYPRSLPRRPDDCKATACDICGHTPLAGQVPLVLQADDGGRQLTCPACAAHMGHRATRLVSVPAPTLQPLPLRLPVRCLDCDQEFSLVWPRRGVGRVDARCPQCGGRELQDLGLETVA